jgi:hypothetical protein
MRYLIKSKKLTKDVYEHPDKPREKKNNIKGGNADNMSIEDIAKYHKVPLDDLLVEFELGKIVEIEHTDDPEGIEEIALDHIYDNPHYYTEGKDKGIFEELENVDIEKIKDVKKSKELEEFEKAKKDPELENKIKKVMEEFKAGTLKDSHGNIIKDRKQALAIAYSQYRSGVVEKSELERLGQTPVEWDHKYTLMGKLRWKGLKIGIENKKGSIRKGTDPDGKPWEVKMNCPYGRITGTKGTDNNNVDVYVGPNKDSDRVFVVHQNNPWTGAYDEDKVMIGFDDGDSAKSAYMSQYNRPDFFGSMDEMTVDELKKTMKACRGSMLRKHPDNMQKSLTEEDMLKINEFLRETEGKIEDEELHEFSEKNGLNTKRVEEYIYLLAQEYLEGEEDE